MTRTTAQPGERANKQRILHSIFLTSVGSVLALCIACGGQGQQRGTASIPQAAPSEPALSASDQAPASEDTLAFGFLGRLETPVTSFGLALGDGHLYTLGGYFGTPHEYDRAGQSPRFARMDLTTQQWEELPSPGRSQSSTLSFYQGYVFRVGGVQITNPPDTEEVMESLATFSRYNPTTGQWHSLPPLPKARSSHGAAIIGGVLYVVGGWTLNGNMDSGVWHETMHALDLTQPYPTWQETPTPVRARALGVSALAGSLVVVGGLAKETLMTSAVHVFDVASNTWRRGPDFPDKGFGVRSATFQGRIYASGVTGDVYSWTTGEDSWTKEGSLAFNRVFHAMAADDQRLVFAGGVPGMTGAGRVKAIEVLQKHTGPPVEHFVLSNPYPAKNRQGLFLAGPQLHLFGGNNSLGQHDFKAENFLAKSARLDLAAMAWHPMPSFPRRRQSMQTYVLGERALAIGGFGLDAGELRTQSEVYNYDTEEEKWTAAAPLPTSRTQFGLAQYGGRLWLFGGLEFDGSKKGMAKFSHPTEVLSREVQSEGAFAATAVQLRSPRRAFAGAQLGSRYYLVGGMKDGFKPVEASDVFNFETEQWETIPAPSHGRIGAELVPIDGRLYLVGGSSKANSSKLSPDRRIEVFDPKTGEWSVFLEELPMSDARQLRATAYRGRILIVSSQRTDGRIELMLINPTISG